MVQMALSRNNFDGKDFGISQTKQCLIGSNQKDYCLLGIVLLK